MNIRFTRDIPLQCVQVLVADFEGEDCELDMNCVINVLAGKEFADVEIDEESKVNVRIWLRDDLVALQVRRDSFEFL